MLLTVFTPTYNRAALLPRVYQSLLAQTNDNFEWIIVDDGSTDTTEQVCQKFMAENKLKIRYFKQENSGKHIAINNGVNFARGDYFMILDSDDFIPKNGLEILQNKLKDVDTSKIGGVVGRKLDATKKLIGSKLEKDSISDSLSIRIKNKLEGDLAEVFKTKVLRKFPFPHFENEKFCPEALVWNRIAQNHQLLFFCEGIYVAKYLENGLSNKITEIRMKSPKASMLYYAELADYNIPIIQKIKAVVNFWRFSFCSKQAFQIKFKQVNWCYTMIALPLGFLFHFKDRLSLV